jgi:hypothetical protein
MNENFGHRRADIGSPRTAIRILTKIQASASAIAERAAVSMSATDVEILSADRRKLLGGVSRKRLLRNILRKQALISETGSPGRIRTGDLSINSRMLYR